MHLTVHADYRSQAAHCKSTLDAALTPADERRSLAEPHTGIDFSSFCWLGARVSLLLRVSSAGQLYSSLTVAGRVLRQASQRTVLCAPAWASVLSLHTPRAARVIVVRCL